MCLAVPGKITEIYRENEMLMGKIDFGGVIKSACLEHVQDAVLGDYVLVHVGFALSRIDEVEAGRVLEFLREFTALSDPEATPE